MELVGFRFLKRIDTAMLGQSSLQVIGKSDICHIIVYFGTEL